MEERLQKILAARGVASRRAAEQLILAGRVEVNGAAVRELGAKADPDVDRISVDGEMLPPSRAPRVLMLNKPVGYVSTSRVSRETGPSLLELVPRDRRYFPVGRLDQNSSGLILLTDDGELANRLTHPRYGTHKVYLTQVRPPLPRREIARLEEGVPLEDGPARAVEAVPLNASGLLRITLAEGRKRQIRRMIAALGARVVTLHRIQIGGLRLGSLPLGHWRELRADELQLLQHPHSAPREQS